MTFGATTELEMVNVKAGKTEKRNNQHPSSYSNNKGEGSETRDETFSKINDGMVQMNNIIHKRYTEISLPFRRFNDMRLDLGARQEQTTFEGRPWYLSWAALDDEVYMLRMDAIEKGVVRPLSIDERVNMAWRTGQDSFVCLMKFYGENVARVVNQTAKSSMKSSTYGASCIENMVH